MSIRIAARRDRLSLDRRLFTGLAFADLVRNYAAQIRLDSKSVDNEQPTVARSDDDLASVSLAVVAEK
jgi:hypothetical protein